MSGETMTVELPVPAIGTHWWWKESHPAYWTLRRVTSVQRVDDQWIVRWRSLFPGGDSMNACAEIGAFLASSVPFVEPPPSGCPTCGAEIANPDLHRKWHQRNGLFVGNLPIGGGL